MSEQMYIPEFTSDPDNGSNLMVPLPTNGTVGLEEMNDNLFMFHVPALVYTAVMMFVGLPGNSIVFYVYFFKWRRSTSRMFILFLAVLDMTNCATTLPMEIYIMRYSVQLDRPYLCKLSRFSTYTMNSSSALILLGIAFDRFQRICRPYQKALSEIKSKYICIGSILFSIASTWPSLFIYGTRTVKVNNSLPGTSCLLENSFDSTPYPIIFYGFMVAMTFLIFTILIVLYYFVGLQIYKHRTFKLKKCTHIQKFEEERSYTVKSESAKTSSVKQQRNVVNDRDNAVIIVAEGPTGEHDPIDQRVIVCDQNLDDDEQIKVYQLGVPTTIEEEGTSCGLLKVPVYSQHEVSSDNSNEYSTREVSFESRHSVIDQTIPEVPQQPPPPEKISDKDSTTSRRSKRKVRRRRKNVRYLLVRGASTMNASTLQRCTNCLTIRVGRSTFMLFLITLAYVLSFLPFYILVIWRESDTSFLKRVSFPKPSFMAYLLFLRSYLLSSAINPIIYSFCNKQFRQHCCSCFKRIFRRRNAWEQTRRFNNGRR